MQDIHDIHPPVEVGMDPFILQAALAVLAIVLLSMLIFFLVRRYLKNRKVKGIDQNLLPEPLPPLEQAMEAIKLLKVRQYHDLRQFYFDLTAILKRYILPKIFGHQKCSAAKKANPVPPNITK